MSMLQNVLTTFGREGGGRGSGGGGQKVIGAQCEQSNFLETGSLEVSLKTNLLLNYTLLEERADCSISWVQH